MPSKQNIPVMPGLERLNEHAFEYYPRLRKVKEYVERHLSEVLSLRVLAAVACTEAKYFSKFFHKKVGIRPTLWVTHMRVAKAIALIQSADYAITNVAHEAGFCDLRTFERAFKKCTGITAQDFKRTVSIDLR